MIISVDDETLKTEAHSHKAGVNRDVSGAAVSDRVGARAFIEASFFITVFINQQFPTVSKSTSSTYSRQIAS